MMKAPDVNQGEADQTSLTLLAKVRQKDQAAWVRLVSLYSPLVYYWCRQWGLQDTDAEEVGQEVFLAVARNIDTFHRDQEGDTFRGWLRTITRNKILDQTSPIGGRGLGGSDAQGRLLQVAADGQLGEDASGDATETNILYRRAIELIELEFEPNTRRAFWLRLSGKPAAEVAEELHMTVGAVHIAKSRVLKRLREEFGQLLGSLNSEGIPEPG
jgi:RNA polymerase sigma-70 factor, ECF subfamily